MSLGRPAAEIGSAGEFRNDETLTAAIARLREAGRRSGLLFDFDGVLAPIQGDPEAVAPSDGVVDVLTRLRRGIGTIAIVSSRNADFLYPRLGGIDGIAIYGLYGLEHATGDGAVEIEARARPWLPVARDLVEQATGALPGVYLEDKRLSVGLHYRRAPHLQGAVEAWAARAAATTGFRLQRGRMAVELKPPVDVDKGSTVESIIGDLRAAWYFGDDLGDLPAFDAVHRRKDRDERFHGLAVGVGNDTIVDEVRRRSDILLRSQDLVVELLRHVHRELAT